MILWEIHLKQSLIHKRCSVNCSCGLNGVPPKRYVGLPTLASVNVIFFGNRITAGVIKVRWGPTGVAEWALNLTSGILIRKR